MSVDNLDNENSNNADLIFLGELHPAISDKKIKAWKAHNLIQFEGKSPLQRSPILQIHRKMLKHCGKDTMLLNPGFSIYFCHLI